MNKINSIEADANAVLGELGRARVRKRATTAVPLTSIRRELDSAVGEILLLMSRRATHAVLLQKNRIPLPLGAPAAARA